MIRQREMTKREQLAIDRQLFEQRSNLRQVKLNLPDQYKEGDEDILINQKVKMSDNLREPISVLTRQLAQEEAHRHPTRTWRTVELTTEVGWQAGRCRSDPTVRSVNRSGETYLRAD